MNNSMSKYAKAFYVKVVLLAQVTDKVTNNSDV